MSIDAPSRGSFENPRWPRNVKRQTLDPFYDRAKEMLEALPLTPPVGLPLPHRTRLCSMEREQRGTHPSCLISAFIPARSETTRTVDCRKALVCIAAIACLDATFTLRILSI